MCFENIPCKATYIVKIGIWNDSQTMWDSFQILALMYKTCLIYVSRIRHACIRLCLHTHDYGYAPMLAHAEGFLSLFFQK